MATFKDDLIKKLTDKGLSESSINLYMRNLKSINSGEEFKNLNMLNNVEEVLEKLSKFKPSTRKAYITCIISVLSCFSEVKKMEKLRAKYYAVLNDTMKTMKETPSEQMTKTQSDNWLDWEGVLKVFEEKKEIVAQFAKQKDITDAQYSQLLNLVVLSLYVLVPPRRNEDYMKMVVKKSVKETDMSNVNYLDIDKKVFVFNVFKTAKHFKDNVVAVPDDLLNIIMLYLKHHPELKGKKITRDTYEPLLVFRDGSRLDKVNSITRILNKIFGKKIGVSMLRHSYLTSKYGDETKQRQADALAMGHSVSTQSQYIKDPSLSAEE